MIVLGNKKLSCYKYIIGLDIAMYKTGVSIYSIDEHKFVEWQEVIYKKDEEQSKLKYFEMFYSILQAYQKKYPSCFIIKEKLPMQCGPQSTISTLTGLATAHALIELASEMLNMDWYNKDGVHSTSVKAIFKTDECLKPSKIDILNAIALKYNLDKSTLTDNITDSMGVIECVLTKKWNQDIKDLIKEEKKHLKSLKDKHAIEKSQEKIEFLTSFCL